MAQNPFPPLPLSAWQPTRDTLQTYAKVLGNIRGALSPPRKHWWHISLCINARGITTSPVPADDITFEAGLDFARHTVWIDSSRGERWSAPLTGQSASQFSTDLLAILAEMDIYPDVNRSLFENGTPLDYDHNAVSEYWCALAQIDTIFRRFQAGLREETSSVQLWPHHFDLAMMLLTGRLVPDQDPEDPEYSDEQMSFGFVTGDESMSEPYFYATAWPPPDGLLDTPLPGAAYWHTAGFTGAVLQYNALVDDDDAGTTLFDFLRTIHQAGAQCMQQ